jgi:hypothetical protein
MVPYAPLGGRLIALKVVFGLMIALTVGAIVSDAMEIALLQRLIDGQDVSDAELVANDDRQGLIGSAQLVLFLAAVVTFIMWLYRAYQNVDAVKPGGRRHSHGWAIGAWFVPILNLFRPKQIVNDIWWAADERPQWSALAWAWWTVFLISGFFDRVVVRSNLTAETPEEFKSAAVTMLVGDSLALVGAVLALLLAIHATRRLDARHEHQRHEREREQTRAEYPPPPLPERRPGEPFPAYPG